MAEIHVDTVVLSFACGLSIATGIAVGLAAAISTVRGDVVQRSIPWRSRFLSARRTQRPSIPARRASRVQPVAALRAE